MKKFTAVALMAALAFAVTPAFAGDKDHACCTKGEKMDSASFASLNLTAEQKTKMDALVEKCNTAGCTKESMTAFMKSAETVLNKEQMVAFKAACEKKHEEKKS